MGNYRKNSLMTIKHTPSRSLFYPIVLLFFGAASVGKHCRHDPSSDAEKETVPKPSFFRMTFYRRYPVHFIRDDSRTNFTIIKMPKNSHLALSGSFMMFSKSIPIMLPPY
jgi:hypothetical protein